ncbi:MAG: winged helix-turn-helix domain-containing protein [Eggerthellaceae bacterium]|nr:winged helix-turn-helix domain-containing protein [Eggerthellaceae bacterium]
MTRSQVAFIANSLDSAYKFRSVLADIGADVIARSTAQLGNLVKPEAAINLIIFEATGEALSYLGILRSAAESQEIPLLVIVEERDLPALSLPKLTPSDFVLVDAGHSECVARVARLLGEYRPSDPESKVTVDDMAIDLNTYQVTVGDEPIDFTYLEYALLVFLVTHPSHAFTRDTLLQSVWGFNYFGGSRTVDVHVRRIRAKIGPKLAQHLKTIRGVGYLWNPQG